MENPQELDIYRNYCIARMGSTLGSTTPCEGFDTSSAKWPFQLEVCRGASSSELLEGKSIIRLSIIRILCDVTNSISELPNIYGMQAS